jgi:hypothetical protein
MKYIQSITIVHLSETINVHLYVKKVDDASNFLVLFDSEGRHFITHQKIDSTVDIKNGLKDIIYESEFNFETMQNDIWVSVYLFKDILILHEQKDNELSLCSIQDKIEQLEYELQLLIERKNIITRYYTH